MPCTSLAETSGALAFPKIWSSALFEELKASESYANASLNGSVPKSPSVSLVCQGQSEAQYVTFRWNPLDTVSCNFTMTDMVHSAFYNGTDRRLHLAICTFHATFAKVFVQFWLSLHKIIFFINLNKILADPKGKKTFLRQDVTAYVDGNFSDPMEADHCTWPV